MPVSITDVRHIATLARLSFTEAEEEALVQELNAILAYMEQLNTLDTTQVEPLSHVIELHNVFREDERKPGVTREEALKNAPARTEEFFTVPKVIG
jgi:aspartyl-tRNA(Asn)/glutamyl-tRNA(Gln) amidotransferase subunit C